MNKGLDGVGQVSEMDSDLFCQWTCAGSGVFSTFCRFSMFFHVLQVERWEEQGRVTGESIIKIKVYHCEGNRFGLIKPCFVGLVIFHTSWIMD